MISCKKFYNIKMLELAERAKHLHRKPMLLIITTDTDDRSKVYVQNKVADCNKIGITPIKCLVRDKFEVVDAIEHLRHFCCPVIIQSDVDADLKELLTDNLRIVDDVDGSLPESKYYAATPKGIVDWLTYNNVTLEGKDVCIIGRSNLVGKPLASLMTDRDATVTLCHSKTKSLSTKMASADIIVSATGRPGMHTGDTWVNENQILIDVGISVDSHGKLHGDFDINLADKCAYMTPVPGGVGLLTRVALLDNVIRAYEGRYER